MKIIISVGRLEKQKNHKLLIDSFAKLHNLYPDYCLVIYGEGAARKELENYISRFSLQKFILLPGNRTNVLDEMKKAYEKGGLGDVKIKKDLYNVLEEILSPIREKRRYYEEHLDEVYSILKEGTNKANEKANKTLKEVKKAIMIDFFEE